VAFAHYEQVSGQHTWLAAPSTEYRYHRTTCCWHESPIMHNPPDISMDLYSRREV
jgi:hypothetical protein